jgi:hypothetical protein
VGPGFDGTLGSLDRGRGSLGGELLGRHRGLVSRVLRLQTQAMSLKINVPEEPLTPFATEFDQAARFLAASTPLPRYVRHLGDQALGGVSRLTQGRLNRFANSLDRGLWLRLTPAQQQRHRG